jgi:hypothetical protein
MNRIVRIFNDTSIRKKFSQIIEEEEKLPILHFYCHIFQIGTRKFCFSVSFRFYFVHIIFVSLRFIMKSSLGTLLELQYIMNS